MKKVLLMLSLLAIFMTGCTAAKPQLSSLERTNMRTRTINGEYDLTFRSLMTVVENQGYTIDNTDIQTGLIKATATRDATSGAQKFWLGETGLTTINLSATVRKYSSDRTRVRINIRNNTQLQTSTSYGSNLQTTANEVDNPLTYDQFFSELRLEMARSKAIN